MKKLIVVLISGAALFLLTGCISLTEEGAEVTVVTDPKIVENCTLKGKIRSYAVWANSTAHTGEKDPRIDISHSQFNTTLIQTQNAAARDYGANVVLIKGSHAPRGTDVLTELFATEISSTAYSCN